MDFEYLIKQYIENNEYDKCISALNKQIKILFTSNLKKYMPNYSYSTMNDLLKKSVSYFPSDLYTLAQVFHSLAYQECKPQYEIEMLLEIYKNIQKKANNEV